MAESKQKYRYLGNLSAVEPMYSISLYCDYCKVTWTGCMDANVCPECGDVTGWEKFLENKAKLDKMFERKEKSNE